MKKPENVYFFRTVSSEIIHKKAIKEFRELNFAAFKLIALRQLCKELNIRRSVFNRGYIKVKYYAKNGSLTKYKHLFHPSSKSPFEKISSCYAFWCNPPTTSVSKTKITVNKEMQVPRQIEPMNISPHISSMREFLIAKKNVGVVNIFLEPGSEQEQGRLRRLMEKSTPLNFFDVCGSAHDCANMLKLCLKEMPDPLFPAVYYEAYKEIIKLIKEFDKQEIERIREARTIYVGRILAPNSELRCLEHKILVCIQLVVHLLPEGRREFFKILIDILAAVYANQEKNMMSATALGTIFAPLVMCPRRLPEEVAISISIEMSDLMRRIIKFGRDIFDAPVCLQNEVWNSILPIRKHLEVNMLMTPQRVSLSNVKN